MRATRMGRRSLAFLAGVMAACGDGDEARPPTGEQTVLVGSGTGAEVVQAVRDAARFVDLRPAQRVAALADGTAVALWEERRLETSRIWSARLDRAGAWSRPELVAEAAQGDVRAEGAGRAWPDVAVDGQGVAWAVWSALDSGVRAPYAARQRAGEPWGDPMLVPATEDLADGPRVAMDPAGGARLLWTGAAVWVNRAEGGGSWSAPERLDGPYGGGGPGFPSARALTPRIASGRQGDAVATWHVAVSTVPHGSDTLRSSRLDPAGRWEAAESVTASWSVAATRPVIDDEGRALVAFSNLVAVGLPPRAARSARGEGWQQDPLAERAFAPAQLAGEPGGHATVLLLGPPEGASAAALWSDSFSPEEGWASVQPLPGESAMEADVAMGSADGAVAAWTNGQAAIVGARLDGARWSAAEAVGLRESRVCARDGAGEVTERSALREPVLVHGGALAPVLWAEFDCTRWTVWAGRVR